MLQKSTALVWRKKRCLRKCGWLVTLNNKADIHRFENSTILLAGHETSATTLCWVLLEVARNPTVQKKLRDEIRTMEHAIHVRGDSDFTATDLDNMPYLSAVIKVDLEKSNHFFFAEPVQESMRFHPALYQNYRQAANDDILPLSKPIKTMDGKTISELPIPKGTKIILSIAAYNRYPSMIPVVPWSDPILFS